MALPFTFIFLAPGAVSSEHRSVVDTPGVALNVVGCIDYEDAAAVAVEFVENLGVTAVELCAGFGNEGIAIVSDEKNVCNCTIFANPHNFFVFWTDQIDNI